MSPHVLLQLQAVSEAQRLRGQDGGPAPAWQFLVAQLPVWERSLVSWGVRAAKWGIYSWGSPLNTVMGAS